MPLAHYYKAPPTLASPPTKPSKRVAFTRLWAPALVTVGSLMITSAIWPIVQYQLFLRPSLARVEFVSPIPEEELAQNQPSPVKLINPQPYLAGLTAMGSEDFSIDPKTWFPEANFTNKRQGDSPITTYVLSIPNVNIFEAKVVIDGEDLANGLVQYPGTALPGQPGSPVIFGHSILRQFYNPSTKNPNRYLSIFSKIMTLKIGDEIFLDFANVRYTYIVKDKVEVKPEDVFILEQRYGYNELKLITCVPEGTYLRRGVVIASLVSSGPISPPPNPL